MFIESHLLNNKVQLSWEQEELVSFPPWFLICRLIGKPIVTPSLKCIHYTFAINILSAMVGSESLIRSLITEEGSVQLTNPLGLHGQIGIGFQCGYWGNGPFTHQHHHYSRLLHLFCWSRLQAEAWSHPRHCCLMGHFVAWSLGTFGQLSYQNDIIVQKSWSMSQNVTGRVCSLNCSLY